MRIVLNGASSSVPAARSFARRAVGENHPGRVSYMEEGKPATCPLADVVEICVSELVSNSVRHSKSSGDGPIELVIADLRLLESGIPMMRITVRDEGGGRPFLRDPTEDEDGGRGLWIVNTLASRWGYSTREGRTCTHVELDYTVDARTGAEDQLERAARR